MQSLERPLLDFLSVLKQTAQSKPELKEATARLLEALLAELGAPAKSNSRRSAGQSVDLAEGQGREGRESAREPREGRDGKGAVRDLSNLGEMLSADFDLISQRLRLKSRAFLWLIEREKLADQGTDEAVIDAKDQEFIDAEKQLPGAYLWMIDPYGPQVHEESQLEELAATFETASQMCELMARIDGGVYGTSERAFQGMGDAFQLLAECQSSLRITCQHVDRSMEDADQRELFMFLKRETRNRRIYVERHMRIDDPADPANTLALREKVQKLRETLDAGGVVEPTVKANVKRSEPAPAAVAPVVSEEAAPAATEKPRRSAASGTASAGRRGRSSTSAIKPALEKKARLHAKRLADDPISKEDWKRLVQAVNEILESGTGPTDQALMDILVPIVENLPRIEMNVRVREAFDHAQELADELHEAAAG